ncbi:MAG: HAD family hydrolase [Spirochaetaceae bacterium]|nr:MAG: HAD family hydrolase [Spirochaetaceae bacterium]
MQGYDLIIWDWNGTLLDDLWLALDVANRMLEHRGLPTMDQDRYREIFDFPVSEYYRRAGFDFDREPFESLADEFIAGYNARLRECRLHARVPRLLEAFEREGTAQSVLSASRQESLIDALAHYELTGYFGSIAGLADHFAVSKIDAGHRLLARSRPQHPVLVGDTVHDFEVADALGVDCILVGCGHHPMNRLRATGARVYESLDDLPLPM